MSNAVDLVFRPVTPEFGSIQAFLVLDSLRSDSFLSITVTSSMAENDAFAPPVWIAALKGLALASAFISGGGILTISIMGIPAIISAMPDTSRPGVGGSPCAGIVEKLEQSTRTKTVLGQFSILYTIGRALLPPSTFIISIAYAGAAWWTHYHSPATSIATSSRARIDDQVLVPWTKYALSAVLTAAVIPSTFAFIEPISHSLLRLGGVETGMTQEEKDLKKDFELEAIEVRRLLNTWNKVNYLRATLMLTAASLALPLDF